MAFVGGGGDPIDGHDVVDYGEDVFFDDADVARVSRVGGEVVFGFVTAMEDVGEGEGLGSDAEDWTGCDVDDLLEGDQGVQAVDHRVDLGWVGVVLDLEEDHVFDGLRRHLDVGGGFGRWGLSVGFEGK